METTSSNWGFRALIAVVICVTAGMGIWYLANQRQQIRELGSTNQALSASLTHVQSELQSVTEKLNERVNPPRIAPAPAEAVQQRPRATKARTAAAKRQADDPRWKQIQGKLSDQEKQIASTRDDLDKTREDLQGKLASTHDELSGSIARTHDELVALQKRGERNYYEFQIDRSKQYQRVGSVRLSLRKVNFKRKSYDLAMMVDDNQLQKKNVNLYEPVWINLTDQQQPLELVVNEISKNQIKGYLSESKYKKSELNQTASSPSNPPAAPRQP